MAENKDELENRECVLPPPTPIKTLKTEDTGKMLEMAICMAFEIPYQGKYKYDTILAEQLKERLMKLNELFPKCRHTAEKGARYDFTSLSGDHRLSAKSTKGKTGKVAPQVIGQPSIDKFCELLGIQFESIPKLKEYIQTHPVDILKLLVEYTFDCANLYYNQKQDTIRFINLITPVIWEAYSYNWTCSWDKWKNSTTLKIVTPQERVYSLVEFQIHTRSRKNLAIRWCYENFLEIFKDNLDIVSL